MANTEFYKGRKKRRNVTFLFTVIILALLMAVAVLFYAMQKYAVIAKDGVSVVLPILSDGENEHTDEACNTVREFETVDVNVVFDSPDYSAYQPTAGGDVSAVRAIYVPYDQLNASKIGDYAARLSTGNALLLEMKPRSGNLMWYSQTPMAQNYGLSVYNETTTYIQEIIDSLKQAEKPVYLAAKISCCIDSALPARCTTVSLLNSFGGYYSNSDGIWLDPYNQQVRDYVVGLARELYDMGFDEVVLCDVRHPAPAEGETIGYSVEMSTPQSAADSVSAFVISVTEALKDREGVLSVYVDSQTALTGTDSVTGQNGPLFFNLFDRVYFTTDRYAYNFIAPSLSSTVKLGKVSDRFVPVVENYLPDNAATVSWVLIDTETDD